MRLLTVAVVVLAVSYSRANLFGHITHSLSHFTDTLVGLGKHEIETLGQQVLSQGTNVLTQTITDLITHSAQGKRGLSSLLAGASGLLNGGKNLLNQLVDQVKGIASSGVQQIGALAGQALEHPLETVQNGINSAVSTAHGLLNGVVNAIPNKVQELANQLAIGKRGVGDMLTSLGNQLTSLFRPHVESLKQTLSLVGTLAKSVASNVVSSLGGLGAKLTGHATALKNHYSAIMGHTTDAMNALKDSVGDILSQTAQNIQPHIKGVLTEATGALHDTANALTGGN